MRNFINRLRRSLFRRVFDQPLASATTREIALVQELRDQFRAFQTATNGNAGASEAAWARHTERLCNLVLHDDPRKFLRWDVMSETMFVSDAEFLAKEFSYVSGLPDWHQHWKKAIIESRVGHPPPCPFYRQSSGNLIHHAYHLAQFEKETGTHIDEMDFVFEFGGGYGSMCRLFNNLGFKGRYLIFDLPEISALQQFFLRSLGMKVNSTDTFDAEQAGVLAVSDLDHLTNLLQNIPRSRAMFVATWSISEAPIQVRRAVMPLIKDFSAFLIAYQDQYGGLDNRIFFHEWKEGMDKEVQWHQRSIDHLPGNFYLMGSRKSPRS